MDIWVRHHGLERKNRFQVVLLPVGIRRWYLSKNGEKEQYDDALRDWYRKNEMGKLFGHLPNFTRYALLGEIVAHVANRINNPQKHLWEMVRQYLARKGWDPAAVKVE